MYNHTLLISSVNVLSRYSKYHYVFAFQSGTKIKIKV